MPDTPNLQILSKLKPTSVHEVAAQPLFLFTGYEMKQNNQIELIKDGKSSNKIQDKQARPQLQPDLHGFFPPN